MLFEDSIQVFAYSQKRVVAKDRASGPESKRARERERERHTHTLLWYEMRSMFENQIRCEATITFNYLFGKRER